MNHWRGLAAATMAGIGLRKTSQVVIVSWLHLLIYLYRLSLIERGWLCSQPWASQAESGEYVAPTTSTPTLAHLRDGRLEKSLAEWI